MRHAFLGVSWCVVASIVLVLVPEAIPAFAARLSPVACPRWSSARSFMEPDPVWAADKHIKNSAGDISSMCQPMQGPSCQESPLAATRQDCSAKYGGTCSPTPAFTLQASGSGPNNVANNIVSGTWGGREHCAVWDLDNVDTPKNNGPQGPRGPGPGGPPGGAGPCPPGGPCSGAGNPINIANGNKYQREIDIPSRGEGTLEFSRSYNSALPISEAGIGTNWTHTYAKRLYPIAGTMKALREDGQVLAFNASGGSWVGDGDMPHTLVAITGGWELTAPDNSVETFDAAGRLISIRSPSGKVTALDYSDGTGSGPNGGVIEGTTRRLPVGLLIRVTDFTGRSLELFYGDNSYVARMVDAQGGTYLFAYDSLRDLTSVTYPDTGTRVYLYNESAHTSGANLPMR